MGSKYTVYLQIKNQTPCDIVEAVVKPSNSDCVRLKDKFVGQNIKAKGGSLRETYKVRVKKRIPKSHTPMFEKLQQRYKLEMMLKYSDKSQDVIQLQQLAVLPFKGLAELRGYKILRSDHRLIVTRDRAGKGFKIEATETQFHVQDKEAQEKLSEGEGDMKQGRYESALEKYELAFKKAMEESTFNDARFGQAHAYNAMAEALFQEALTVEGDHTQEAARDAQRLLEEARNRFRRAQELFDSYEHGNNFKVSTLMIEGNELFNEGGDFQDRAFSLLESGGDMGVAQRKLYQALMKYEAAGRVFERGLERDRKKFGDRLDIVKKQIVTMEEVICSISENIK